jgi:hypothetical protein
VSKSEAVTYDGRRPTLVKLKIVNGDLPRINIEFDGSGSWC